MFRDSGEAGKEAEHAEAESKKREELRRRIHDAQATSYHAPLLQVCVQWGLVHEITYSLSSSGRILCMFVPIV